MKMNTQMKMAKVLTITTYENNKGLTMKLVATLDAKATPEQFFAEMGLIGRVKSFEVSMVMPLPYSMQHSFMLQKKLGIIK